MTHRHGRELWHIRCCTIERHAAPCSLEGFDQLGKEDVDRDTYPEALRQVIEAKLGGKQTAASEQPAPSRVTDLMEALKRSLKERPQELSRAAGRRPRASRRGGRKNAAA